MDVKKNIGREQLVTILRSVAADKLDSERAAKFLDFILNGMHFYPDAEYLSRPEEEIFFNIYGLFQFAENSSADGTPNKARIKAFNPQPEVDGWASPQTFIYINQRDMPFLVDSLRMALNRRGLNIFTLQSNPVWVLRDTNGQLTTINKSYIEGAQREAFINIEVDIHRDAELAELQRDLLLVLDDVQAVVDDFDPMRARVGELIEELTKSATHVPEVSESLEFLRWIYNGYFTFLGCAEFDLVQGSSEMYLRERTDSRLGLLNKYGGDTREEAIKQLSPGVVALYQGDDILTFTKSSRRSRVHRNVYSDYLVVKRFNDRQQPIGEVRFLGLYTSQFYSYSPRRIPILREKVNWVMDNCGFEKNSHDGKTLQTILDFHPRDELFHLSREDLADTAIGIWQIQERRVIKVFMHADPFDKFVCCIVYLPRESFNTAARIKIQQAIGTELDADESEFASQFLPESVLVRIHLVYQLRSKKYLQVECEQLESLVATITSDWCDSFTEEAVVYWGERDGRALGRQFQRAFPAAYRELYKPLESIADVLLIDELDSAGELGIAFNKLDGEANNSLQLKLFHWDSPLELSDMIPMLENLGFRVMVEHPYLIVPDSGHQIWLQDFRLSFSLDVNVDVSAVQGSFKDALRVVWQGEAENDSFNRLVIGARLDWRSVAMLRLYARYLKQLGIAYSQNFIADTLAGHLDITRNLVALFKSYFDPRYAAEKSPSDRSEGLSNKIRQSIDAVENVSEDMVLRGYLEVLEATLRTNFFQTFADGSSKSYISVKLQAGKISLAPKPRPEYEIFVYSPRVEGVHLRGGKVARGGLRWSDRFEDYRTEVLGLVKAQQVKNAVIVPTGAKGGFVAKQANMAAGREAWLQEGISSYMLYVQALLDISDNLIEGEIMTASDTVRRDGDDPYLVVAADKGTATFSDTANQISEANNFWLGDAFASGGGNGYDHKAMGITARGGWVAVQRHFREIGRDIQREDFTVVGIGDMGGDVFGNGMLLSKHIQLVAAFNHLHIFVDPNPDCAATFVERKRLFETPRATWDDFDKSLMSKGSAVYSRSAKSLQLTPEIMARFALEKNKVTPAELITAILKSPVDLIWNGGIGTYVKAASENNAEVGDRANDGLRVNGRDLRCKVFGEGGNLGLTQRGRIEYSLSGGICNTDFIDNAAGVDCSDHEVNIKILLNKKVREGSLSAEQRNRFLASMTDAVAELVLHNNARQTQAISLAMHRSEQQYAEYQRFMGWLEDSGKLDRELEFLPTDEQLSDRLRRGQPVWTRPELAVLVCYSKVMLKEALLDANLLDDPVLAKSVNQAFPQSLVEQYPDEIAEHQLRPEIAATQLANDMVDRAGFTFFFRQSESTGASAADIVRAFTISINILGINELWQKIENSGDSLSASLQLDLLHILMRLVRRSSRWLLRNRRLNLHCHQTIQSLAEPLALVLKKLPDLHESEWNRLWHIEKTQLIDLGVEESVAATLATAESMFISVGTVEMALRLERPAELVARLAFKLGEDLSLDWFMSQIVALQPQNRWQDLARESYVDDLESQRRQLTSCLLKGHPSEDIEQLFADWQIQQSQLIARWKAMVVELRRGSVPDFAMVSVALRELLDLVESSVDAARS
ncbi:MAG: NAD-glutamate dehydrogenase [Porticoccaceae bacterium]|nr:NAD-glutamate dehydrogenase [Porticoccaceae bacterium]